MLYYSPVAAAEKLGLCKVTILRRIRDGSLTAIKHGRRTIRISEESLQKYITDHTT